MSDKFINGYALLIGVGESAYSKLSLPVTVKDAQAIYAALVDPELCAYPDDKEHIRVLNNQEATKAAILDGLNWLKEKTISRKTTNFSCLLIINAVNILAFFTIISCMCCNFFTKMKWS